MEAAWQRKVDAFRARRKAILEDHEVSFDRFGTDVDISEWTHQRRLVAVFVTDPTVEALLAILVACSLALTIIDTDHSTEGEEMPAYVQPLEMVLLFFYILEMVSRCYVLRMQVFIGYLNCLDLFVVATDVIIAILNLTIADLPQVFFLRLLRLARLARVSHILESQKQLALMVDGFVASMKTIFWGVLFIAVIMAIYSVVAVEYLYPLEVEFSSTCSRCPRGFSSFYASMCTLIQTIIVCDEWGDYYMPFLDEHPHTIVFISVVFVTINFGIMNLIMAVIVDSAAQARIHNMKARAAEKDEEFKENQRVLNKICAEMDTDSSGCITVQELIAGYEEHLEFRRTLCTMDLNKDDLVAVFNILDEDQSGEVKYDEFVQQLHKMKESDNRMLVFIQHYVTELGKNVREDLDAMKTQMAGGIGQLNEQVLRGMQMIKENMDTNLKAIQKEQSCMQKEIMMQDEKPMLPNESTAIHSMEMNMKTLQKIEQRLVIAPQKSNSGFKETGMPPKVTVIALPEEKLATEGQLQIVTNQIAGALEDLRCNCERSAELLTTFNGLLPSTAGSGDPHPSCLAKACEATKPMCAQPGRSNLDGAPCAHGTRTGDAAHEAVAHIPQAPLFLTDLKTAIAKQDAGVDGQWAAFKDTEDWASVTSFQTALAPDAPSLEFSFRSDTVQLGFEVIWVQNQHPVVGKVSPKGAANACGLLQGDRIIEVNRVPILEKDRRTVLRLLRERPLQLKTVRID